MRINQDEIIQKTTDFVKERLESDNSGHDWWHTYRVWKMARSIGERENVDVFVIELAALLHDVADWKFHDGDTGAGSRVSKEWLKKCGVDPERIKHVCDIVENISFKGAGVNSKLKTKEGMSVQDADRLDAIGAVGIARVFTYGGSHNDQPMHDPENRPIKMHQTFEEYKNKKSTSINHFYEKLLLLKDLMNTKTGKEIAKKRHKIMEDYLKEFFKEWEGEDLK